MEIVADVKIAYKEREGWGHHAELYAKVIFKETGKFFKTKIERVLIQFDDTFSDNNLNYFTNMYNSYDKFVDEVARLSNNQEELKEMVKQKVRDYIMENSKTETTEDKLSNALNKIDRKFTIKVKIDE